MSLQQAITEFRGQFRGAVLEPADAGYDEARKVYNGMIDRKPRLIAKCADVGRCDGRGAHGESQRTCGFPSAAAGTMPPAWASATTAWSSICRRSITCRVDPSSRTVLVGGGLQVERRGSCHACVRPGGAVRHHLQHGRCRADPGRRHGTPDPEIRTDDRQPALGRYGAGRRQLRGRQRRGECRTCSGRCAAAAEISASSPRFCSRRIRSHTVCAGPMLWNLEDAADVMKWYREFITQAPEEMNGFFAMMTVPPGPPFPEELHLRKMCGIVWCYQGSMEQANTILEPIRSFRPPAFEFFVPMPFPMLQGMFDRIYPPGLQWYWKADFFKELSDAAIEKHLEHARAAADLAIHHASVSGEWEGQSRGRRRYRVQLSRCRLERGDCRSRSRPGEPRRNHRLGQGLLRCPASLRRRRRLLNFMMEEGDDRIRATYRGNYDRLAAIKAKYDPETSSA